MQVQSNLENPQGTCIEVVRGLAVYYAANPFKVKKYMWLIRLSSSKESCASLRADDVRDRVCDIMAPNCTDTFGFNNFTSSEECKAAYGKLDMSDDGNLDGNMKGCRIIHSSFVPKHTDHCPHSSFAPMKDRKGIIKSQKAMGATPLMCFLHLNLES